MVLEFQNSPLALDELKSREAFYGHMVWIVNATSFLKQFRLLSKLPDPKSDFTKDLIFHPEGRAGRPPWYGGYSRKSELMPGFELIQIHGVRQIKAEIERYHIGHFQYDWRYKRSVWFSAQKPVFLDFGDPNLWWLQIYDERGLQCVQRIRKETLITKNGGSSLGMEWPAPILVEEENC